MNIQEAIYQITNAYLNNRSIESIVFKTYDIIKNPIMILDERFSCLAYMPKEPINNQEWMQIVEDGYANESYIKKVEELISYYDESSIHSTQIFEYQNQGKTKRRLVNDITENGNTIGGIEVLEYYRPFESWHRELLDFVAKLLYAELERTSTSHDSNRNLESSLLLNLLASNETKDVVSTKFKAQAVFQNNEQYLLALMPTPPSKKYTIQYLLKSLDLEESRIYLVSYYSYTALLFHDQELNMKEVLDTLTKLKEEYDTSIVYSDIFSEIYNFKPLFEKALHLFETNIICSKLVGVYSLKHLSIEEKLLSIEIDDEFLIEQFKAFKVLSAYDKLHDSDMLITLETYLQCFLDINETSERLFIHRNTLTYRLKKIASLTNFDLENKEECLDTLLLLRVFNYKTK